MKMRTVAILCLIVSACVIWALSGCARTPPPRPIEVVTQRVEVAVPAPCPVAAERDRLRGLRPPRLIDTPMPPTPIERVAKIVAQLGLYEAQGAFADQVDAALDRCQQPATP